MNLNQGINIGILYRLILSGLFLSSDTDIAVKQAKISERKTSNHTAEKNFK